MKKTLVVGFVLLATSANAMTGADFIKGDRMLAIGYLAGVVEYVLNVGSEDQVRTMYIGRLLWSQTHVLGKRPVGTVCSGNYGHAFFGTGLLTESGPSREILRVVKYLSAEFLVHNC